MRVSECAGMTRGRSEGKVESREAIPRPHAWRPRGGTSAMRALSRERPGPTPEPAGVWFK